MPGTPPIPSAAHSTSSPVTRPAIEAERRGYYRDTAPLAAQSLREVLQAHFHREFRPQDIWNTLVNTRTYAGRELHDLCEAACPNGPLFLEMVTLLMLPEADRSLDRLSDAGVFLIPTRDLSPSLDASALLRSDKGLMLWLQYAATPTGYLNLFDASDIFGEPDDENTARIDKALQVMVACGRAGLRVPHDISLCGFDDSWVAKSVWPYLTTVYQPIEEMGYVAASLLIDRGETGERQVMLGFHLVERDSLAPPS